MGNMRFHPFVFTGKERDPETGYSYFGARYYDCDLSGLFLSVDPMSDKYPRISPYAYCAWNPVKLVDQDGMELNPVYDNYGNYIGNTMEGFTGKPVILHHAGLNNCLNAENKELSELSAELVSGYGGYFDDVLSSLSGEAQSKIWTDIVSSYNNEKVDEYTFDIDEIGGSIKYDSDNIINGNFATSGKKEILGRRVFPERYETTVENVIATVVYHEWLGHIKNGYSGCGKTKTDGCDHYKCYELVILSPIFQNTTQRYRSFYKKTYEQLIK